MDKRQRPRVFKSHSPKRQMDSAIQEQHPHHAQLNAAIAAISSGDFTAAEQLCLRVIRDDPQNVLGAHLHSIIQFRQGKAEAAVAQLQSLVSRQPDYTPAWQDLGNMLHEVKRFPEAIATFRTVIARDSAQPAVFNNLGVALKDNGELDEAIAVLRQVVAMSPEYLSAWLNLGYSHLKKSESTEALVAFDRACQLAPQNVEPLRVMAQIYRRLGDDAQALKVYQRWLVVEPDSAVAQHMLTSLTSGRPGEKAPEAFVREEFDRFADSFDLQLETLNYQGPQLILEAICRRVGAPRAALDILDGGCGTGAAGQQLRPFARRLCGIDLSSKMLSHARRTGAYDDLVEIELGQFLELHPQEFDLIALIDTFIYFGDLAKPLAAAARALRPSGFLFFTVELARHDIATNGFMLDGTGRFIHASDYIHRSLIGAGFVEIETSTAPLRHERGEPVIGSIVSAKAPSANAPAAGVSSRFAAP